MIIRGKTLEERERSLAHAQAQVERRGVKKVIGVLPPVTLGMGCLVTDPTGRVGSLVIPIKCTITKLFIYVEDKNIEEFLLELSLVSESHQDAKKFLVQKDFASFPLSMPCDAGEAIIVYVSHWDKLKNISIGILASPDLYSYLQEKDLTEQLEKLNEKADEEGAAAIQPGSNRVTPVVQPKRVSRKKKSSR